MSEKVPRLDVGERAAGESPLFKGLDKAGVERLADQKGGHARMRIQVLASDRDRHDDNLRAMREDIDSLLAMYEIQPQKWVSVTTGIVRDKRFGKDRGSVDPQGVQPGTSAGDYLYNAAYMSLGIEYEEEGYASTSLSIRLAEDLEVILHGNGEHWTQSTYTHPHTGQRLYEGEHDAIIHEIEDVEGDFPADIVDVIHQIEFEAEFKRPD